MKTIPAVVLSLMMSTSLSCFAYGISPKPRYNQKLGPLPTNTQWNTSYTKVEFSGFALNSTFNLPVIKYNISRFTTDRPEMGTLEFFNAMGAGIGFSYGTIRVREKNNNAITAGTLSEDLEIDMKNIVGLSVGFLFSKTETDLSTRTIFAPTISLQVLDFQFGYGYELGTVSNTAHRSFITVSYGIAISKFTDKGSYLLSNPASYGTPVVSPDVKGLF